VPLTWAAGRFLGHELYGLNQHEPMIILAAVTALALSGLAAAFIPALRASSISPMQALRAE
jgi:ABC-type antimicrobial peptide transport system permease subunit